MDPGLIEQKFYPGNRGDERRADPVERLLPSESSCTDSDTDSESLPDESRCLLGLRQAATDSECGSERSKGGDGQSNEASCVAFSSDSGDSLSDAGDVLKVEEDTGEKPLTGESPHRADPEGKPTAVVVKAELVVDAREVCLDASHGKDVLGSGDAGVFARFTEEPRAAGGEGSRSAGEELGFGSVASEDERVVGSMSERTAPGAPTSLEREASAPKTPNHGESRQRIQLTVGSSQAMRAKVGGEESAILPDSEGRDCTDLEAPSHPHSQTTGGPFNEGTGGGEIERNSRHENESAPLAAPEMCRVFSNLKNLALDGIAEHAETVAKKETPQENHVAGEWGCQEFTDAPSNPMLRNGKEPRAYNMEVCLVPMSGRFFSHDDRIEAGESQKKPFVKLSKIDTIDRWPHDKFAGLEAGWQRREANAKKFKENAWRKKHSSMGRRLGTKPKRSNECGVQADLDSPVHSNAGDDSCITKQILSGAFYGANSEKSVNSKPVQNTPRIQHKDDQSKWARPFHKRSEEKNIRRYSEKKTAGFNSDSKISESTVEPKNWPQSCGVESWGPVHEEPLGKTLEKNEWISNPQNYSSNRDSGRKSSQANPIHDRWTTWVPPEEKEKSYAKGTPPLPPNPKPKAEKLSWKNNDWQWGTPATPKANQECENAEWGMPSPTVSNKIWTEGGKGVDWLPKSYFDSLPDPFKTAPNCGVGRRARVGPDVGSKQRKWKSSTWKKKNTAPSRPLNPEWGGKYSRPQAIFSTSTQEYDCPVKCLDGAPGGQVIGMQPENNCLAFSGSLSSTAPISPMRRVFEWIPSPATDFAGN